MAEETKQPDITEPVDGVASEAADSSKSQANPLAAIPSKADADKNAKVEEAKARLTAAIATLWKRETEARP